MVKWPEALPFPIRDTISFKPLENAIRSSMDVGMKVRRRFTWVPEEVTFSLRLTSEQVAILQAFVKDTLKDVLPFEWKEFRLPDGSTNVARYRFRKRPSYTPAGPNYWDAAIELDLLQGPML